MELSTFFEKFDQFADAPDAVAKLRELVLELAMQGKLAERKASEGDGHSLLKKLRTLPPERHSKSRPPKDIVVEPETSLKIPSHWALTTVENSTRQTGFFCDGDWVESKDQDPDGDVRLIQLADVGDGQYRDRSSRFMTKEAAKRLNCSYLEAGDILIARMPDPLGRCCRFPGDSKPAVTVVDVCILRSNSSFFDPDFLVIAINCPRFRHLVLGQATGTTRSRISRSNLGVLPIPLPPLAEQKRIVAKVDELMALCDRLEVQQQERETRHAALARASLARFGRDPQPSTLNLLFYPSSPISPADLRKSILTLAVQGKLVPQHPNDEPAQNLIAQISTRKRAMIAAKQIRQGKVSRPQSALDAPSEVPRGWKWVNVDAVCFKVTDGTHFTPKYASSGVRFVSAKDIVGGRLVFDRCKFITREEHEQLYRRCNPEFHDIVISKSGSIGTVALVEDRGEFSLFESLALLKFDQTNIFPPFLVYVLTHACSSLTAGHIRGIGVKHLHLDILRGLEFSLPPLAEQRRIVAKVERLMALVDALEQQLAASRATAEKLLTALVAELTRANPSTEKEATPLLAAEAPAPYGQPAEIIPFQPSVAQARLLLAAEIAAQLHGERYFHRIKFMKLLYACEHVGRLKEVQGNWRRAAAGPYDDELINGVEHVLAQRGWFKIVEDRTSGQVRYELQKKPEHRADFERLWSVEQRTAIRRVIDLARHWQRKPAEMFATTYAAWNDLLIQGEKVTDDAILTQILERWHADKKRIPRHEWREEIQRLHERGMIPTGFGRATACPPNAEFAFT